MGVKDEIRKLNDILSIIQAVLLDAEEINNQVKVWLNRLEGVVYDAVTCWTSFVTNNYNTECFLVRKVHIFFSRSSNHLVYRYKMAKKIKQIRETLDEIKANRAFLELTERSEKTHVASTMSWRETHSFVIDDEVIGRDGDKKEIIELSLESNVETVENVSIVSLVGFGGFEKTALANTRQCLEPDVLREQDLWPTTSLVLAGTGHMLRRCSAPSTWIRVVKPVPAWVSWTNPLPSQLTPALLLYLSATETIPLLLQYITSPTTTTYPGRICPYGRQRQPSFCPPRQVRPHVMPTYWASSPCRPTYPPGTLSGQYGRVAPSTQAH
ncbi:hypothetical protein TIFTF001_003952 [Ficus carica]|uniref:Disease resistance N-terminal domain-containing protein n=1 Tax=Ficus carica TaxID=3494 RepID=A0AA87ZJ86_FICCA|nr:hypothetical protein TIFTF001_003952 [Ficus carica]